jgi:hypothetical protein
MPIESLHTWCECLVGGGSEEVMKELAVRQLGL